MKPLQNPNPKSSYSPLQHQPTQRSPLNRADQAGQPAKPKGRDHSSSLDSHGPSKEATQIREATADSRTIGKVGEFDQ